MKTKARRVLSDAQADVIWWLTSTDHRYTLSPRANGRWMITRETGAEWSYPSAATVRSLQDAGYLEGTTVTAAGLAALVRDGFR